MSFFKTAKKVMSIVLSGGEPKKLNDSKEVVSHFHKKLIVFGAQTNIKENSRFIHSYDILDPFDFKINIKKKKKKYVLYKIDSLFDYSHKSTKRRVVERGFQGVTNLGNAEKKFAAKEIHNYNVRSDKKYFQRGLKINYMQNIGYYLPVEVIKKDKMLRTKVLKVLKAKNYRADLS